MLCRDASTPVAKVDHATGDIDGHAVSRSLKEPWSASLRKLGSFPSSMNPFVMTGSSPSSPSTIARLISLGPRRCRARIRRRSVRNGHEMSEPRARKNVMKTTASEPTTAKPAPGPTYAWAWAGYSTAAATAAVRKASFLLDADIRLRRASGGSHSI